MTTAVRATSQQRRRRLRKPGARDGYAMSVGEEGLEPSRVLPHRFLKPARLPFPPLARAVRESYQGGRLPAVARALKAPESRPRHTIDSVGLARELERRLERLVDGATAAVFRGRMHPVDMADHLVRQLDFMQEPGLAGPEIPNSLIVTLNPADIDPELDPRALSSELANTVSVTAADRGWRVGGPVTVRIRTDGRVPRGLIDCEGTNVTGWLEPWGTLIAADGGTAYDLADNRVVVGRDPACDVLIDVPEISRRHALVVRDVDGVHLWDLASANGTWANGTRLGQDRITITSGDLVLFANLPLTFQRS